MMCRWRVFAAWCCGNCLVSPLAAEVRVPMVTSSNVTFRVMAANITTGNNQRYEGPGLRIFQALKPDIVAVQEFNYASTNGAGISTPAAIREMINAGFGGDFVYYRESGTGYTIPNGIISRWPVRDSGTWDDIQVPDRGFAWAQVDIPGPKDLFVVSVHLHSSGGSSSRAIEAASVRSLIQSNFPPDAFIVVAGDLNTDTRTETAVATFKTFLSDDAVPADQAGDPDTNQSRAKPYDYLLPSFNFASNQTATFIGTHRFPNGLVFDSDVLPLLFPTNVVFINDSTAVNMQHMAVIKDFRVTVPVTNLVTVTPPTLTLHTPALLHWTGLSQLAYTVQTNDALDGWKHAGTVLSTTTNFWFTNAAPSVPFNFFRVVYP